ncbi:protein SPT2 homolog [Oryctolagus cuniculus]|uniref:protein SPT2 homolog n=1 Tax=Oryctolagus cuniculus TaxID=9986 RepID=UPI00387924BD
MPSGPKPLRKWTGLRGRLALSAPGDGRRAGRTPLGGERGGSCGHLRWASAADAGENAEAVRAPRLAGSPRRRAAGGLGRSQRSGRGEGGQTESGGRDAESASWAGRPFSVRRGARRGRGLRGTAFPGPDLPEFRAARCSAAGGSGFRSPPGVRQAGTQGVRQDWRQGGGGGRGGRGQRGEGGSRQQGGDLAPGPPAPKEALPSAGSRSPPPPCPRPRPAALCPREGGLQDFQPSLVCLLSFSKPSSRGRREPCQDKSPPAPAAPSDPSPSPRGVSELLSLSGPGLCALWPHLYWLPSSKFKLEGAGWVPQSERGAGEATRPQARP